MHVNPQRIKTARMLHGLSQRELASRMEGTSRATVARWEGGRPTLWAHELKQVADITGLPIDWFFQEGSGRDALCAGVAA